MPSLAIRILLFFSSYFPLFLILSIQNYSQNGSIALIPVSLGVLSCIGLSGFLRWVKGSAARVEKVASVQRKDSEVMAYIFTYIFPFIGIDFGKWATALSLAIFFAMLLVIYVNSNLIHINPVMAVFGYHVYEIETPEGSTHTVISRRSRLIKGQLMRVVMIGDDLFLEKDI